MPIDRARQRRRSHFTQTLAVVAAILLQAAWYQASSHLVPRITDLGDPPSDELLRAGAAGEPISLAYYLMLSLQNFDNQPGISIPFADLDYVRLEKWLDRMVNLAPDQQYPFLAATRIYSQVNSPQKQRQMLEFLYRRYGEDPARRWPWLAQAAILAKHRLNDKDLALKYAKTIADTPHEIWIPSWARQMQIFLLADQGEYESARLLIGGLLAEGLVKDEHELHFLHEELKRLENL